jgi:hypothetical protein
MVESIPLHRTYSTIARVAAAQQDLSHSFEWGSTLPSPELLGETIAARSALWPSWNWGAILEKGLRYRNEQGEVADALKSTKRHFKLPESSCIVESAWIEVHLIRRN